MRLRYDPRADEPEVDEYDQAALCTDPLFRNRMVSAARNHKVFANYHDGVTFFAISMCGTLGASLGRQCEPAFGGRLKGDDIVTLKRAIMKMRSRA
jgi:hypothetical protein